MSATHTPLPARVASFVGDRRAPLAFMTVPAGRERWIAVASGATAGALIDLADLSVSSRSRTLATVDDRFEEERRAHDEIARQLDPTALGSPQLGPADRSMLEDARISPGMHVLDLGCGQGDLTVYAIEHGAQVTALDISPGMVALTAARVKAVHPDATPVFVTAPFELSELPAGAFDLIIGRFVLHHLDVPRAAAKIADLLRTGGKAVFLENSARNGLLIFARNHIAGRFGVPRLGTKHEQPLGAREFATLRRHFDSVELCYPSFDFFTLLDRQVFRYKLPIASRLCAALDRAMRRVPWLRQYSYRVVVVLSSPSPLRSRSEHAASANQSLPRPGVDG